MKVVPALIAVVLYSYTSAASTDSGDEVRRSPAIQYFMQVCVVGRGVQENVASLAEKKGMQRAEGELAKGYLAGNRGVVWVDDEDTPAYALTSLANGLCSVFAHDGNAEHIQQSMEAWLPPKGSGFTYATESLPSDEGRSTTSYTLYSEKAIVERWIISKSADESSPIKAIMSYDAP